MGIVGKTLKKGPPKIKSKAPPKIKSRGPYTRGSARFGKAVPTSKEFKARRDVLRGVQKKKGIGIADIVGAGAAGFAVGKGWHKKLLGAVTGDRKKTTTHKGKAKKLADEAIKKQKGQKKEMKGHHYSSKSKKEKRKSHH